MPFMYLAPMPRFMIVALISAAPQRAGEKTPRACFRVNLTGCPVGLPPTLRAELAVQAAEQVLLFWAQQAQRRVLQGRHERPRRRVSTCRREDWSVQL